MPYTPKESLYHEIVSCRDLNGVSELEPEDDEKPSEDKPDQIADISNHHEAIAEQLSESEKYNEEQSDSGGKLEDEVRKGTEGRKFRRRIYTTTNFDQVDNIIECDGSNEETFLYSTL